MINLPSLETADVRGKRVFVRCDFDIPLNGSGEIADETRLVSSISTIEYLLQEGAIVIAAGHLGRPSSANSKQTTDYSLLPVARWFTEEFPGTSLNHTQIGGLKGWKLKENFYILENLRLDPGEEKNDSIFTHKLAYISDVYINEAFGSSHRNHASIIGLPNLLPHFVGFHFQKEVKILSSLIENPKRPLTIIVGGAKIETKLPLISKMHKFADYVLVGGELAQQDEVLIKVQHENIIGQKAMLLVADLNSEKSDITSVSLENFEQVISRSSCVVWNGPMGKINEKLKIKSEKLAGGDEGYTSLKLAEAMIASSAYKVVGGGDTIAFLNKHGLGDKFDFASTGGGAMLEFLSGVSLPGIIALQN